MDRGRGPDYFGRGAVFPQRPLGSIELVTDAGGHLVERLKYDPFGMPIIPGEFNSNSPKLDERVDVGFTSHKQESALRLIDMRARWYDPAIGRFLSPDPLRLLLYSGQA